MYSLAGGRKQLIKYNRLKVFTRFIMCYALKMNFLNLKNS